MTSSASSSPRLSTSTSFSDLKSAGISVPSRPSGHIRKDSSSNASSGSTGETAAQSQSQSSKDHGEFQLKISSRSDSWYRLVRRSEEVREGGWSFMGEMTPNKKVLLLFAIPPSLLEFLSPKDNANSSLSSFTAASSAFSPGGPIPQGYSYLARSHSLVTPTRSRPRGMDAPNQSGVVKEPAKASIPLPRSATTDSVLAANNEFKPRSTSRPLPPIPTSHSTSSTSGTGSNSPSPLPSPSLAQGPPPRRSKTLHSFPSNLNEEPGLTRSQSDAETLEALVTQLPPNPKQWTPSQVAVYLSHVLGLTPRPIVEDVTAYVRRSRMGGRVFLRLREEDLEKEGLNLKWRGLMMEAVRKLRRSEC